MHKSKPLDLIAVSVMLILCLSWAFQQITIKYALPELGPFAQGTIRSTGASLMVILFMIVRYKSITWMSGLTGPGLFAGLLFGGEFMLLFVGLTYTDASRAVLFLYTAPFVVAIGSHFMFPGEELDLKSSTAILLAFAGVAISLGPSADRGDNAWIGDLMSLGAGILWGLSTLVIKGTNLRHGPASQVLLYQLLVSAIMFGIGSYLTGQSVFVPMSSITVASMIYQVIWISTITFGIWFALIVNYSATSLSVITFVTPIIGAYLGYLFLDEPIGLRHMIAVTAVALGILLITLPRNLRDRFRRRVSE